MTHEQIVAAQHQAGWHPARLGFAVHQGNAAAQMVHAAIQPQIQPHAQPQIQAPVQQLPPAVNNLIANAIRTYSKQVKNSPALAFYKQSVHMFIFLYLQVNGHSPSNHKLHALCPLGVESAFSVSYPKPDFSRI